MFYTNFLRLCNSIHKSPSAVAEEIGIKKSTVTRWKQGNSQTPANIQKVADYFGVTVAELTGEDQKEKPALPKENELTDMQQKAFDMIKQMTDDQLKAFIAAAEAFLK